VAGFFGDVDAHDPLEERVDPAVAAEEGALDVVDRVLAAEYEHEEQGRGPVGEANDLSAAEAQVPFLVSGLEHPQFTQIVADLTAGGIDKLAAAANALSAPT
jgi:hypothetical protein